MSELDPFNGDTDACLAHINLQKFPVKETLYGFRQCGTYHTVFNSNPTQELDDALVIDSN
jgi:hypothetical protein